MTIQRLRAFIAVAVICTFVAVFAGISFLAQAPQIAVGAEPQWDGGDIVRGTEPPIDSLPMPEAIVIEEPIFVEPVIEEATDDRDYATVQVNFATNRRMDAGAPIDARFTGDMGQLVYGVATVSIPRDHEKGVLETQGWLMSLISAPNPERHVLVQDLGVLPVAEVLARINAQAGAGNRAVLVYIHGYNTSFDKAARRMGQMTYDLKWPGAAFFYSWPSRAEPEKYFTDDTAADQSVRVMTQVLTDLASIPDADKIILIAHSMGTRVLSEALEDLVVDNKAVADRITTVILAAPDIDKNVFINDIAPRFEQMQNTNFTLYASAEDSALKVSKAARGFPRLGDTSGGLALIDGIEIVDATGAESDFFGHTYFGDNVRIIDDMTALIQNGLPAENRPLLVPVPLGDGTYWQLAGPAPE